MNRSTHDIVYVFTNVVVEVNFSEDSYSVAEGDSQVSVSLRITGKYFIPVYAIVKVSSGTATGETC